MPKLSELFPDNLRKTRAKKKVSQSELGEKAGLSTSYVSMLERGERTPPLDTVDALARALDVPPLALLKAS